MIASLIGGARWDLGVTCGSEISGNALTFKAIDLINTLAIDARIVNTIIDVCFTIFASYSFLAMALITIFKILARSAIKARAKKTFINAFLDFFDRNLEMKEM